MVTEAINELKADKAEKDAAEMEKLATKARVGQEICDGIMQEGVYEAIRSVAEDQYRLSSPLIITEATFFL